MKLTTVICLIFWGCATLFGQNQEYTVSIRHFDITKGLSNNDVFAIHKDSRGLMWIGTRNGLNSFDGKTFKQYHNLNFNSIHQIEEDAEGFLWIIGGFEVNTNQIKTISFFNIFSHKTFSPEKRFKSLPFKWASIKVIKKHQDGKIYLGLQNGEIYTFHPNSGFSKLAHQVNGFNILNINFHKKGEIWIFATDNSKQEFKWILLDNKGRFITEHKIEKKGKWHSIGRDNEDNIWYLFRHINETEEIYVFKNTGQYQVHPLSFILPQLSNTTSLKWQDWIKFYPIEKRRLISYSGKLSLLDKENKTIIYDFSTHKQLDGQLFRKPVFENKQTFWLPTSNGFFLIRWQKNPFNQFLVDDDFSPSCRGIWQENDSTLIVNTYKGTFILNPKNPKIYKKLKVLQDISVPLSRDNNGEYWFGGASLIHWNPKTNKTNTFTLPPLTSFDKIRSLVTLPNGNIGFCGSRSIGFFNPMMKKFALQSSTKNPDNIKLFGKYATDFINNYKLYSIEKDREGNLWCLTTKGLFTFDFKNGLQARYGRNESGENYLPASIFRHLYQDIEGIYWLATGDGGLIRWDKKKQEYQQFTTKNGLTTNAFYALFGDDYGNIWLSSDNGITQFDKKTHQSIAYLPQDGTTSYEFNRGSHFQGEDGTIYFGSLDGITAFNPKDFVNKQRELPDTKLIVTGFEKLDNQSGKFINQTKAFLAKKEISLYPKDQFFKISFLLDDYFNQEQIKYAFRIKNYEKEWNETTNNEIRIGRLPYGKYVLEIKGRLPNGQFSKQELHIPITVICPYYLQWWFIVLMLAIFIFTVFKIFEWRTAQIYKRKEELEKLIKERTEIISQQTEKLKNIDRLKTRFFTNISHELRTPLSLILGPIDFVLKGNQLNNRDFSLLTKAKKNSHTLLRLIREILDISKLESKQLKLTEKPISLYTELRQIFASFESQALHKGIEFQFYYKIKAPLILSLDQNKLVSIVQNLLSNALKFTHRNGKVSFTIEEKPSIIFLTVKDTGKGISEKNLDFIFNRFYQGNDFETINSEEGGTGIGLAICKEYVKLMGGKIWVKSPNLPETKGSSFYVELPKKEVTGIVLPINIEKPIQSEISPNNNQKKEKDTILIVEDNIQMVDHLKLILQEQFHIITAENGKQAIRKLNLTNKGNKDKNIKPLLIISDIMMPVMDGFQFLTTIKKYPELSNIPIVMLTAKGKEEDKLKALRIGVDDYLVKPFSEEELKARISNLIENDKTKKAYIQNLLTVEKSQFSRKDVQQENTTENNQWLEKLEKLTILHHANFNLSVETLAHEMNMGRTSFFTKVKRLTGLSPKLYLQEIRLIQARAKLENGTEKAVKAVAYSVGMKDVKYFSQLFKKRFGILPSQYL